MAQSRNRRSHQHRSRSDHARHGEEGFTCLQCGQYVSCDPGVSGVQNRNHCPACLWSRHVDLRDAGDRLAACRAAMRPIGLTTKRSRNKYARGNDGELMIIHRCTGCDKLVINRIAADDSTGALCELFERSLELGPAVVDELAGSGVTALAEQDRALVQRHLFGNGPPPP
jgi:hypothetical protein